MQLKRFFNRSIVFIIIVFLGYLIDSGSENSAFTVQAQSEKKTVKLARTINPQVKLSDVKVKQKDQKLNEDFDAEPDWVKNLSFKLENISGKPIIYLSVSVTFPETRVNGNLMSYQVVFGQLPDSKLKNREPMSLKKGETLEISLDKEKDKLYKFVNSRQPIESIQKVELEIGFIVFEDKTAWAAGTFMRQDPNNPDRYNPTESEPRQP